MLKLGIVYKDNCIINHRSLFKVIFNPIFRVFGFHFVVEIKDSKLLTFGMFNKTERQKLKWEQYRETYDYIEPKRRLI